MLPLRPMLEASSILARLQCGEPDAEIPPLPAAVREIRPERLGMTVGNLAIHSPFLLMIIGDADEAWAQTERMLIEARERGLIGGLPHILLQHSQAELAAEHRGDGLGRLRLANARRTFEQQGLAERQRQIPRRRKTIVGKVLRRRQGGGELFRAVDAGDGAGDGHGLPHHFGCGRAPPAMHSAGLRMRRWRPAAPRCWPKWRASRC